MKGKILDFFEKDETELGRPARFKREESKYQGTAVAVQNKEGSFRESKGRVEKSSFRTRAFYPRY